MEERKKGKERRKEEERERDLKWLLFDIQQTTDIGMSENTNQDKYQIINTLVY